MSDLFVANLTKQHHIFIYQVVEGDVNASPNMVRAYQRHENIPAGGQSRLPGDLTKAQIDVIVEHHRAYGMKSWEEARKIKGFTGLCFRLKDPIPLNDQGFIDDVVKSNDKTLNEANDVRREATTAAISERLNKIGSENRNPLHRTEVEQVEDTDGTPRVASGVEMPAEGIAPRNQGRVVRARA